MKLKHVGVALLALLAMSALAVACGDDDDGGGGTLKAVQDRGNVIIGVKDSQPGLGNLVNGVFQGQDVEFAHAIAAAIFGDRDAVEFVAATAGDRFELLGSGEIDVLIRTTTWTSGRDIGLASSFTTTTFYDGQGILAAAGSPFQSIQDLDGATICVTGGTTTEINLETQFNSAGINYTPLVFAGDPEILEAFLAGRCNAWTADKSNLAGQRFAWPADEGGPASVRILPETLSKEPLGPVVRDGDTAWFDLVQWVVFGTILAEELGITSANVAAMAANPPNADVAKLLGVGFDGGTVFDFGKGLGLEPTFMQDVISQVGNYGEIYAATAELVGLTRAGSLNALWTDGGLIFAPPVK